MLVDTLILAGALNQGLLKECASESHEALIKIAERPMVEYVIQAVNTAKKTNNVALVGPAQKVKDYCQESVDFIIDSQDSMIDNIKNGIQILCKNSVNFSMKKYILLLTSDIPLISGNIIDDYISSCLQKKADIYFPITSKEITEKKFPGVERTYVKLSDGVYTGGNIILIRAEVLLDITVLIDKVFTWRKNPLKLSQLLGFKFLIKLLIGFLSLNEIEDRVSEIVGYKGRGIITEYPEIAFDVDKPGDLFLMKKYFKRKNN